MSLDFSYRMDDTPVRCQIIRYLGEDSCVIRLKDTGAVVPIKVSSPLDVAKIALVTSLRPVEAKAVLGPYEKEWFRDCRLIDVDWMEIRDCFPCPTIHRRKKARTGGGR
jgi:hypothetical protein